MPYLRPTATTVNPTTTTALDHTSVEKCSASASRAWLSYFTAIRLSARERHQSTAMEQNITRNAVTLGSISTWWKKRRFPASHKIQRQVSSSSPVSMKAEKFSTLPWPYWWSASAGLSETRTESSVMIAATRSSSECAASDRMPKLPVAMPTTILKTVMAAAAKTEFCATARFSARIESTGAIVPIVSGPAIASIFPAAARCRASFGAAGRVREVRLPLALRHVAVAACDLGRPAALQVEAVILVQQMQPHVEHRHGGLRLAAVQVGRGEAAAIEHVHRAGPEHFDLAVAHQHGGVLVD